MTQPPPQKKIGPYAYGLKPASEPKKILHNPSQTSWSEYLLSARYGLQ